MWHREKSWIGQDFYVISQATATLIIFAKHLVHLGHVYNYGGICTIFDLWFIQIFN